MQPERSEAIPKLDIDFIKRLSRLVADLGDHGETVGGSGFRLILSRKEKNIDVISVLGSNGLTVAVALAGNIPDNDDVYNFKAETPKGETMLIYWDKRISREDVEIAMINKSMN